MNWKPVSELPNGEGRYLIATKRTYGNGYSYDVANFCVDVKKTDYNTRLDLGGKGSTFYAYDSEYGCYRLEPEYWCEIISPEEGKVE